MSGYNNTSRFAIPTDPGEDRETLLESTLRGLPCRNSGLDPNFHDMFRSYRFQGETIYGTKADTVNLNGFFAFLRRKHGLDGDVDEAVRKRRYGAADPSLVDVEGMWRGFWSETSIVHHRDVQRFAYMGLRSALVEQAKDLEEIAYLIDPKNDAQRGNQEAAIDRALKIQDVAQDILEACRELYIAKVGSVGVVLSDTAREMIRYSQGYQLSSVPKGQESLLDRARLLKVDVYSGITKNQISFDALPSAQETERHIRCFLDGLTCVSLAHIKHISVPATHPTVSDSYAVTSTRQHSQWKGEDQDVVFRQMPHELRVRRYDIINDKL